MSCNRFLQRAQISSTLCSQVDVDNTQWYNPYTLYIYIHIQHYKYIHIYYMYTVYTYTYYVNLMFMEQTIFCTKFSETLFVQCTHLPKKGLFLFFLISLNYYFSRYKFVLQLQVNFREISIFSSFILANGMKMQQGCTWGMQQHHFPSGKIWLEKNSFHGFSYGLLCAIPKIHLGNLLHSKLRMPTR